MRIAFVPALACSACVSESLPVGWVAGLAAIGVCTVVAAVRLRSEWIETPQTDAVCLSCRYDLSGLGVRGLCPECGAGFPQLVRTVRRRRIVLLHRRVPAVALAWVLAFAVTVEPWLYSSGGRPLTLPDLAHVWWLLAAGEPAETVDLIARNRARARLGDPSAASVLFAASAFLPALALLPRRRTAMLAMAGSWVVIHLGVGWNAFYSSREAGGLGAPRLRVGGARSASKRRPGIN